MIKIRFFYILLISSIILYSCGGYNSNGVSDEGSITFKLELQDTQGPTYKPQTVSSDPFRMAAIDCTAIGISTVDATVYDSSGTTLASGSWNCSVHTGTINNISAGSNRRVVINGKDSGGSIKYIGEQTGIAITANSITDVGTITITATTTGGTTTTTSWTMLKLSDTGQTGDYTTTFGEDSDYSINLPSYTDNGNGTITDNVTGLIWQKEDDNTSRTWADASTYCDNLTLGGQSDWGLPSDMELMSIVNYGIYNPSINTTYFPNTNSSSYWSSTAYAGGSSLAWYVYFGDGGVSSNGKSSNGYVRCVRGGQ